MPPRKPAPAESPVTPDPVPPGPHSIEVRVNGKIVFLQRMHSYTIDQQDDHAVVHAVLKLPAQPADVPAPIDDPVVEQQLPA